MIHCRPRWRPASSRACAAPPWKPPSPRRSGVTSYAGRRHEEIEDNLEAARVRLNPLAALALTGDASKGGEVLPKLNAWGHHYHPYELAPTAAELTGWLDQAAQIVTQVQAASATSAPEA